MYKNIVLDLGGVCVEYKPQDFLMNHFLNKQTEDEVYALTFGSPVWQQLDAGLISREEANRQMLALAEQYNRVFEVQTVIDDWASILKTKNSTVKTMCNLKLAGYRLFYLSNVSFDILEMLSQRQFFSLFEGGVASCELHVNKPNPRIYTALMQKYHLAYDETIFIDDNRINAQAASDLGIVSILYKNPKSFNRALNSCGIVTSVRSRK